MKVLNYLSRCKKPAAFDEIVRKTKLTDGDVRTSLGRYIERGRIKMVNRLADYGFVGTKSSGYKQIEIGYVLVEQQ